jgi:hypothetical protein
MIWSVCAIGSSVRFHFNPREHKTAVTAFEKYETPSSALNLREDFLVAFRGGNGGILHYMRAAGRILPFLSTRLPLAAATAC